MIIPYTYRTQKFILLLIETLFNKDIKTLFVIDQVLKTLVCMYYNVIGEKNTI